MVWDAAVIGVLPTTTHVIDALLAGRSAMEGRRIMQAAVAGRWEQARSIDMPTDERSARRLVRDASALGDDVAVEFEWLEHPLVFVGARRTQQAAERSAFEQDVVQVAKLNPAEPAVALATLAGGPPAELTHIELGAANAWQSVGPLRLWTAGQTWPPPATATSVNERPDLARCIAPVALEVAFRRPRDCWIGVEVSTPTPDAHIVDPPTLSATLERLFTAER